MRSHSTNNNNNSLPLHPDESKYLQYGGSKEFYPTLANVNRTPPERDYATTLQMRQNAVPLSVSAAMMADCVDRPYNGVGDFWSSCPVHGPTMMAAAAPATAGIFRTFRPRMDHIYEVPKFDTAADDNDVRGNVGGTLGRLDRSAFPVPAAPVPSAAATSGPVAAAAAGNQASNAAAAPSSNQPVPMESGNRSPFYHELDPSMLLRDPRGGFAFPESSSALQTQLH